MESEKIHFEPIGSNPANPVLRMVGRKERKSWSCFPFKSVLRKVKSRMVALDPKLKNKEIKPRQTVLLPGNKVYRGVEPRTVKI